MGGRKQNQLRINSRSGLSKRLGLHGVDSRSSWFSIHPTSKRSSSPWWTYHNRFEVSPLRGYCGATPNHHRFGYSKNDKQYVSMEIFTPNGTTVGFPHIILDSPQHGRCQDIFWAIWCHSRSYWWKQKQTPMWFQMVRNIWISQNWKMNQELAIGSVTNCEDPNLLLKIEDFVFPAKIASRKRYLPHIHLGNYHNLPT